MEASLGSLFLGFSAGKLEQLSSRVADCLNRLPDDAIWARAGENENAPGNLGSGSERASAAKRISASATANSPSGEAWSAPNSSSGWNPS